MGVKIELNVWERFGRLEVIKELWRNKHWKRVIECKCDCWNVYEALLNRLRWWATRSCWCLRKEIAGDRVRLDIKAWSIYGKLTVVKEVELYKQPNWKMLRMFACKCNCWNTTTVRLSDLTQWKTKSCWCLHKEMMHETKTTHWQSDTKIYNSWSGMKARCYNKNSNDYLNYGGRWIRVNNRWHKFENFYDDMWKSFEEHNKMYWWRETTIERIDHNWNYVKSNCKRATQWVQANNKRNNVLVTNHWKTMNLSQRAKELWVTLDKIFRKVWEKEYTHQQALDEYIKNNNLL